MLKLVFGALLLILLTSLGLFKQIDDRVALKLASQSDDLSGAILSDALRIGRQSYPISTLRHQLPRRRYRELESAPKSPGEFSLIGDEIKVITREFRRGDGEIEPSRSVTISSKAGKIWGSNGQEVEQIFLEPQLVAHLGQTEQRAANYKRLAEIPKRVQHAVLAIEDERFYDHFGVDVFGIARAMFENLRSLAFVQGGSTITQQYAKNVLFSPKRSIIRKVQELFAALSLEHRLTKDEILELYLNEVYLGQEGNIAIHGVAEAAETFFGKDLSDLSVSEAAFLAGIIQAPSYYAPRRHLTRSLQRRDVVLRKMHDLGFITKSVLDASLKQKASIVREKRHRQIAPHFVAAIRQELEASIDMPIEDLARLNIHTGLDLDYQRCAEEAVEDGMFELEKSIPRLRKNPNRLEAALIAIEPYSGKVRAWVGGRDFSKNQFNHVSQALRQIGSTVKAFLYLTAMDGTLNDYRVATSISILPDEPMQVDLVTKDTWEPENFDKKFRGDVSLRYALEHSLNMPAVYVGQKISPGALLKTLQSFRVVEKGVAVPALALGAADTNLLRLTAGYGAIANGGTYIEPRLFTSIMDHDGALVYAAPVIEEPVADENATYVLTDILRGVIERGTASVVRQMGVKGDFAGKTGTSDETRDAWFVGFSPDLVAGVWVGFDDNRKTGLSGGKASAPIWAHFMRCLEPIKPSPKFVAPSGVTFVDIDSGTGKLATRDCPANKVITELFVKGTEPIRYCPEHGHGLEFASEIETDGSKPRRKKGFWETLLGQ